MRASIILLAVCLAAAFGQAPTFQARVSQVRVDIEVSGGTGPISGLKAADFRVKDNGDTQPVAHVSQNEEPLDVILLFDVSGSMKPTVERIAQSARRSMAQLRAGDRVAVMTFASRPRLLGGLTEDLDAVQRTIERDVLEEPFEGWTRIWDASFEAGKVHFRQGGSHRRRAVVIITDNYGQKGQRDEDEALESLWEADAILCGVVIPNEKEARRTRKPLGIERLVEQTGGDTILSEDAGEAFARMIERIRSRYSIYYAQPQGRPGEFRRVKVELQGEAKRLHPQARIIARKGYRLPD